MTETPLHKAVRNSNIEAVKTLLSDLKIDVNAKDPYCGNTALHLAVILQKDERILSILCDCPDIDVNIENNQGLTALQYALNVSELRVAKIFLDSGGLIDSTNLYGKTALHLATRTNNVDVIEYLVARGADVNARDANGRTPLHLLAIENHGVSHMYAFRLLLNNKADVSVGDEQGRTPLDYLDEDVRDTFLKDSGIDCDETEESLAQRKDFLKLDDEEKIEDEVVVMDDDWTKFKRRLKKIEKEGKNLRRKVRRLKVTGLVGSKGSEGFERKASFFSISPIGFFVLLFVLTVHHLYYIILLQMIFSR